MNRELEFHAGKLPSHANPDGEAERLPLNYLQMIVHYKWRLLAGLLVGIVLGHLLYLKAGPQFEAFSEILVQRKYAPPLREEQRLLGGGSLPSEHIKLILSPKIASEAVKLGHLDELETFRGDPDPAELVLDSLKVKRVAGQDRSHSNVFDIRYTSKKASDAEKVVASVVEAYEQYLHESSNDQSQTVQGLAKNATENIRKQLSAKEAEYEKFLLTVPEEFRSALGNKTQTVQTQTKIAPQDVIQSLGEERTKNRIRMAELRSRQQSVLKAIEAGDSRDALEHQVRRFMNAADTKVSESMDNSTKINVYQSQLIPLLVRERELARDYGRDWPELQSVRRSIETIVHAYRKLGIHLPEGIDVKSAPEKPVVVEVDFVALYLAEVKQQLSELQIKDDELGSLISEEQVKSGEFSSFQTKDQHLRGELSKLEDLWIEQLDREASVSIEKDSNGHRMTRLSPVKNALVLKRMLKFYSAGAAICLFLVALTCVFQELSDMTIKTVRDVRSILHQPVLGSVCDFVVPTDNAGPTSGVPHPALRFLHAPLSVEAETYRTVRASLLVTTEMQNAKVLLISSPEPSDGKTTTASNLSIALAQSGKRVLLIDGDLRRPTLHRMFRIPQPIGLTEVLSGSVEFANAVRKSTVDGLSLMTTGISPANPAEILSSPNLHWMLNEAKQQYDFVLVDAPPMLAVSDPCVMARNTDGVLLVVRLNKNPRSALIRVRELLNDQGIHMIGAIVNGVPGKGGHEYGYKYYGEYAGTNTSPSAMPAHVDSSKVPSSSKV